MIYLESKSKDPYYNLALEEYAFNVLASRDDIFMLWQNSNTIVIGKNQNALEEINADFVKAREIKVARRLSGGGAVYHDQGNLNFTFIVKSDGGMDYDFKPFVQPIIEALSDLGIRAEFQGRNDIAILGKKISGNAQYVRDGKIMHHGCIMLDSDLEKVEGALKVNPIKYKSKSVKSVRSRVTTINQEASEKITMEEFKNAIKSRVFGDIKKERIPGEKINEYTLTKNDENAVKKLVEEKYATYLWNYGSFPSYSINKEEKFEGGLVSVSMEVKKGRIEKISISGDFFGDEDICGLEEKLKGLPLDEHLEERLFEIELEKYMMGISAGELIELIR